MQNNEPAFVGFKDFAKRIGVSRPVIYKLVKELDVQVVKIGTRTLIPSDECDRIIGRINAGRMSASELGRASV